VPSGERYAHEVASSSTSCTHSVPLICPPKPLPGTSAGVRSVNMKPCSTAPESIVTPRGEAKCIVTSTMSAPGASV
jgi:hypothetical protein